MDSLFMLLGPTGFLILLLFLIILAVLWTLLPFAVFGIKKRLDNLGQKMNETVSQLENIKRLLSKEQLDDAKLGSDLEIVRKLATEDSLSASGIAIRTGKSVTDVEADLINLYEKKRLTQQQCEKALKREMTLQEKTIPEPDYKECKFCAEKIKRQAIVCPFCGRDLT